MPVGAMWGPDLSGEFTPIDPNCQDAGWEGDPDTDEAAHAAARSEGTAHGGDTHDGLEQEEGPQEETIFHSEISGETVRALGGSTVNEISAPPKWGTRTHIVGTFVDPQRADKRRKQGKPPCVYHVRAAPGRSQRSAQCAQGQTHIWKSSMQF